MTDAERRAAVNRQIDQSLEAFDARLAREQVALEAAREAAAAARSSTGGGGAGGGGDAGGAGGLPGGGAPAGGAIGSEGDDNAPPPPPGGDGSGRASRGNRPDLPTPKDISDGRDDDVVARQLREAAERETDPALRERLWKEYRDYKKKQ